jgi:NAD(P)H-dependent FMN reductase
LDFLDDEWADKPTGLVTYRSRGGGLAATQLRQVLQGLHMHSTETNIELRINDAMLTDEGHLHDIDAAFADYLAHVTKLAIEVDQLVNDRQANLRKPTIFK